MIHDPQSLYDSIAAKIKEYAATRPGGYFVADDVEVKMCLNGPKISCENLRALASASRESVLNTVSL